MPSLSEAVDQQLADKQPKADFKQLLSETQYTRVPKVGDVVRGKIIKVSRGEVKIDIDGLTIGVVRGEGLYNEAKEYAGLKVGNEVEATVLELENENGEMELSFREAGMRRAWDQALAALKEGRLIAAKVIDANKGGLILAVDSLTGFMPVSQLKPEHYPRVAGGDKIKILEALRHFLGQEFSVKVIDVNEREEKLIVSEKAVWEAEKQGLISGYAVGDIVEGAISALTNFGAFIRFDKVEGLIHISEIAWQRIDHPKDVLKAGDIVKAQIIQIDGPKIFLSIKRLTSDPWKGVSDKYKVGEEVKGKVLKVNPFGLFVELDPEIHGLAHVSELSNQPVGDVTAIAKPGDVLDFEIISIEPAEHRLGLRIAGVKKGETKREAAFIGGHPERIMSEQSESKSRDLAP